MPLTDFGEAMSEHPHTREVQESSGVFSIKYRHINCRALAISNSFMEKYTSIYIE
jgi:hypothetical protein